MYLWFPCSGTRRYTQVRESRKSRHFGRDAEIQAMDGNKSIVQMLDSGNMPTRSFMFAVAGTPFAAHSLPSLDAGFRHPCRNDGPPIFMYNVGCSDVAIRKSEHRRCSSPRRGLSEATPPDGVRICWIGR